MKTDIIFIEKGQAAKAENLLRKNGFKTYNNTRFRFDINTAVVVAIATMLIVTLGSLVF
jgi:hypothetical protein